MESNCKIISYIVVVDEDGWCFRYTRSVLQSTLQLMGCKPRHSFKISQTVYEVIRNKCSADDSFLHDTRVLKSEANKYNFYKANDKIESGYIICPSAEENTDASIPFEFYKRRTTAVVTRETFLKVVCDALSQYKYIGPNQRADLVLACRIRERKESVTVLLCGTSGCGKSTLSSLLGSRLGITTVISTDSIRHMMRSFVDEKQNPLLWASTYHAGECLDPVAVAEAKTKRKAKKLAGISGSFLKGEVSDSVLTDKHNHLDSRNNETELVSERQMAIEGYKAQSEMVIDSLDRLISAWEDRKESVIVEGVHLSINFVMGLMKKHPSIVPFMIYIANEDKHMERFAVRAKYMTLDPKKNKYVKYIRNIRAIQEYLCSQADKHLVPKVNNTNVDRSVAAIHATVFSCLRRRDAREVLYDYTTNTVPILDEEYRKQCNANSMSSKGMFKLIQRQGSSRHLMALVNSDGSVSKAWPVEPAYSKSSLVSVADGDNSSKGPIYGPLQIGKAEAVNLQFGSFGISAWPSDTGGTSSHAGSVDESKADVSDTGTRYFSSRFSSPSTSDEPAKELKDDISVSVSEEEADDLPDEGSHDDQSDLDNEMVDEEVEGSVDEGSTKSDDEEFEDLAMQDDIAENGYWSDDDDEKSKNIAKLTSKKKLNSDSTRMMVGDGLAQNYREYPELSGKVHEEPSYSTSLLAGGNWRSFSSRMKRHISGNSLRFDRRFLSFPALGKSKF